MDEIVAIAVGGIMCIVILIQFGDLIITLLGIFFKKTAEPIDYLRRQVIPTSIEQILIGNYTYYIALSQNEKMRFTYRLNKFMKQKEFIGRKDLIVTEEMRVLISASAIQLTFGLDEYLMPGFPKIFIYPDEYYSKLTGKYHKGEVNLGGAIAVSWKNFKEGFSNPSDNYNLGLHEMAHALRFGGFKGGEFDYFFAGYFNKWLRMGMDEFNRIKKGEPSMLRHYAGANINEYFSVCIEYFFESPREFKERLPEIYKHMCILLNQDPSEKSTSGVTVREKFLPSLTNNLPLYDLGFSSNFALLPLFYFAIPLLLILFVWMDAAYTDNIVKQNLSAMILLIYVFIFPIVAAKIKKIKVYKNGMDIAYPFFPFLHYRYAFERIALTAFNENRQGQGDGFLIIKYLNRKNEIRSKKFILNINDGSVKKIISIFQEKEFLVTVIGYKSAAT